MLRTLVAMILLALAIAATWAWFHPPTLPEMRSMHVRGDDDWQLPNRGKRDMSDLVATIEQDKLWGDAGSRAQLGQVEEKPLTAPDWRIVGVVSDGKDSYVMVQVEGQPMQQLKTGDKLPGGIKIINMTADHVCILLNGKKRVLKTYKE